MKINRITIHNFKGLSDVDVQLDGNDAFVSGQNGLGKTSFADAYFWLMTGKMLNGKTGKIKRLVDGVEVNGENHFVEVEFDNGTIFRKELSEKGVSDTSAYFINGIPLTESKYKASVNALVPDEMFPILSNLFASVDLKWQDLRAILIKVAGNVDFDAVASSEDFAALNPYLDNYSATDTATILKNELRALKAESLRIPAMITENQRQIDLIGGDKVSLQAAVDKLQAEYDAKLGAFNSLQINVDAAEIRRLQALLQSTQAHLLRLKTQWQALKAEKPGICPTCKQAMNRDRWQAHHDAKLAEITAEGKQSQSTLNQTKAALKNIAVDNDSEQVAALKAELKSLQNRLIDAKTALKRLDDREALISRNEELQQREIEVGRQMSAKEYLLTLTAEYQRRQADHVEGTINSAFEFVHFKLFDILKNGDIKACCEPMLNGVPYSHLSYGEKFKVACDILKTLQTYFGVELPIFIDNAESYTSNSYVDLPNQSIQLIAKDGVRILQIDVITKELAA